MSHRRLLALLACVPLALLMAACGSNSPKAASGRGAATATASANGSVTPDPSGGGSTRYIPHEDQDRDDDSSNTASYFDSDDYKPQDYPSQASLAEKQGVASLVRRYLSVAAADNGATACSLIYSLFEETIVENYGQPPAGPPALRGSTCAEVLNKLFKLSHRRLANEATMAHVASVRVEGNRGLVLLRFKALHGRMLEVHRERGAWKIDQLLTEELS